MAVDGSSESKGAETPNSFDAFFRFAEPRLRAALVAAHGPESGRDAAAEALGYAWEHWDRVEHLANPVGYLYRIGSNHARRQHRRRVRRVPWPGTASAPTLPEIEPGLAQALGSLSNRQRQVVVLVSGFGLSHAEAASVLGTRRTTIQNHYERGMGRLRQELGVSDA